MVRIINKTYTRKLIDGDIIGDLSLKGSKFVDSVFRNCNLTSRETEFVGCRFENCRFTSATSTNFETCTLKDVLFGYMSYVDMNKCEGFITSTSGIYRCKIHSPLLILDIEKYCKDSDINCEVSYMYGEDYDKSLDIIEEMNSMIPYTVSIPDIIRKVAA